MICYLRLFYRVIFIGLLTAVAIVTLNGCGSSPPQQKGPAGDAALERFNRAARQAFNNGQIRQAAGLYRQALDRATVRDDSAAILDARYNLAVCLMDLQSYGEALEVVRRAYTEMVLADRDTSADFLLLEATIHHRSGDPDKAWQLTDQILSASNGISSVITGRTHFLRGLIASEQGDTDRLRASIEALGRPTELRLHADRQELSGRLAMAEQNWDAAADAFDATVNLRREALDYRGMVRALVWAGQAGEKAGRLREAAIRYLRAGRSAFLQDHIDDAESWLKRAVQLANPAGEDQVIQEADSILRQIVNSTAAAPGNRVEKATPPE